MAPEEEDEISVVSRGQHLDHRLVLRVTTTVSTGTFFAQVANASAVRRLILAPRWPPWRSEASCRTTSLPAGDFVEPYVRLMHFGELLEALATGNRHQGHAHAGDAHPAPHPH